MPAAKPSCSSCRFWVPKDPSLDGGRELIGTCTKFQDYELVSNTAYRAASWQEQGYLERMRKQIKEQGAFLQLHGGDGEGRAYFRTAAAYSCNQHTPSVESPQRSLTEGARA